MNEFVNTGILPDQTSIDSATDFITKVMVTASQQAGMKIKKGAVPRRQARLGVGYNKPRLKQPKWFDKSCHEAYLAVKKTSSLLSQNPRCPWLRGTLSKETKTYNRNPLLYQR